MTIKYKPGDRVTVRSIKTIPVEPADRPVEIAAYPSLIGVCLTIEAIEGSWIICKRSSGTFAPALITTDLEFWREELCHSDTNKEISPAAPRAKKNPAYMPRSIKGKQRRKLSEF